MLQLRPDAQWKARLATLRDCLATGLIERETPIRLALLATLAGEHLLLVGPPGTAKSELARRLRLAIRDAALFERLLTRFTVPEELFGPLSIKELENDRYHRQTEGYLPAASIAFLDEIFKANSAILNSLLTLLNEREFDNGTERVRTPLVCVIGASNELPEGEELNALYDRFLLRCGVPPVSPDGFDALLDLRSTGAAEPDAGLRLTRAELEQFRELARAVTVPVEVKALLKALRAFLETQKIAVSDRRWRKIVYLLQVSALSHGRMEVSIWDGWLLQHCVWEKPEQRDLVHEWYQSRLGTASAAEPERFSRLVAALEKQLEKEKQSRSQLHDEKGRPVYLNDKGKHVVNEKGRRRKMNADKEPLFLAPPDQGADRTRGNKGLTQEELGQFFNRRYYDYDTPEFQRYVADENNWFFEPVDFLPVMEPTRYSKVHIEGRVRQVYELSAELSALERGLNEQIASVTAVVDDHLWISPGFSKPARANLEQRLEHVQRLQTRLVTLRTEFLNLPRSEE
jgi:MoxR-like ATPase